MINRTWLPSHLIAETMSNHKNNFYDDLNWFMFAMRGLQSGRKWSGIGDFLHHLALREEAQNSSKPNPNSLHTMKQDENEWNTKAPDRCSTISHLEWNWSWWQATGVPHRWNQLENPNLAAPFLPTNNQNFQINSGRSSSVASSPGWGLSSGGKLIKQGIRFEILTRYGTREAPRNAAQRRATPRNSFLSNKLSKLIIHGAINNIFSLKSRFR